MEGREKSGGGGGVGERQRKCGGAGMTIELRRWWRKDSSNGLALVMATVSFLVN